MLTLSNGLTPPPAASPDSQVVYVLTTDVERTRPLLSVAADLVVRLETLFPKQMPVPADATAVVVDLDFLCLDEHEKRRYVTRQLFQPLHPVTAVVSRTIDWDAVPLHKKANFGRFRKFDSAVLDWLVTPKWALPEAAERDKVA